MKTETTKTETLAAIKPPANGESCDFCGGDLHGSLVVTGNATTGGSGFIQIAEAAPRNWILCDGCNAMLCRECAPHFKTGYCEGCIREYELTFNNEGRLE